MSYNEQRIAFVRLTAKDDDKDLLMMADPYFDDFGDAVVDTDLIC